MFQVSTQPTPEQAAIMADYKTRIVQLKLEQDAIFAQAAKDLENLALEQIRIKLEENKDA